MLPNVRQRILPLVVIFLSLSFVGYLFLQSQTTYHAEADSYVEIWTTPSVIFTTDATYQLNWQSEHITSIYLNEQGKVGAFQEPFIYDVCQTHDFLVNFENRDEQTLQVRLFLLSHPLVLSLLLISFIAVTIVLQPFNIPILNSISDYFSPLFQWGAEGFWHKWLVMVLFGLCFYIGFLYLGDSCQEQPISTIGQHFYVAHLTLMGTGILAFFGFMAVVLRPSFSQTLEKLIRLIPYPLVIVAIFAYWGCCFFILLILNTLVDTLLILPLFLLIFIIGALVIHSRLQPDIKLSDAAVKRQIPSGGIRIVVLLIAGIIWIVAYRTNWVAILNNDLLQIGIGIVLFLLPGMLLTFIILPTLSHWSTLITTGFILSFALASGVWLVAVLLGLSADMMQWLYVLIGLAALMTLSGRGLPARLFRLEQDWQLAHTFLLAFGLLSILMIVSIQVEPGFGHIDGDYTHYNPLVMDYAQSSTINLLDPYLGGEQNMIHRMWLVLWTVPQSLVIAFSQMHILVSFQLIAVYLTILWAIAVYDITRRFDVPELFSLMAIPIGVYFLTTHLDFDQIGLRFLISLPQDKLIASLILTPLAIVMTFEYLQKPSRLRLFLTFITIMCVMLAHPTVYFYACMVLGIMTVLYVTLKSHQWQHIVIIAVICGIWMAVPLAIRVLQTSTGYIFVTEGSEDFLLASNWVNRSIFDSNGEFLGINPQLVNVAAYITMVAALTVSIVSYRRSNLLFLIVPIGLLLVSVLNPFTSLMVSKFVTIGQLWRMPWLIPYGVIGAMTLWLIYRLLSDRLPTWKRPMQVGIVLIGLALSITSFDLVASPQYQQDAETYAIYSNLNFKLNQKRDHPTTPLFERYQTLSDIATMIRMEAKAKVFILADTAIAYQIPSMGADFHSMTWHTGATPNIAFSEFQARNNAHALIFDESLTVDDFITTIETYHIDYVFLSREYKHLEQTMSASGIVSEITAFNHVRFWKILR